MLYVLCSPRRSVRIAISDKTDANVLVCVVQVRTLLMCYNMSNISRAILLLEGTYTCRLNVVISTSLAIYILIQTK